MNQLIVKKKKSLFAHVAAASSTSAVAIIHQSSESAPSSTNDAVSQSTSIQPLPSDREHASTVCHDANTNDETKDIVELNDLNENCLRSIFACPTIDVKELLSVACVSSKLRAVAKAALRTKCIDGTATFAKMGDAQVELFFRHFGSCITSIDLSDVLADREDRRLQLMAVHCENVVKLKCTVLRAVTRFAMAPLLPTLKQLTLVSRPELLDHFRSNTECSLEKLELINIMGVGGGPILPVIRFPKLKFVGLESVYRQLTSTNFFEINSQLRTLHIFSCTIEFDIDAMIESLPNLVDLRLRYINWAGGDIGGTVAKTRIHFAQLSRLKTLELYRVGANTDFEQLALEGLADAGILLQELCIYMRGDKERITAAISKQILVERLDVEAVGHHDHLKRIVEELAHLKEINVYRCPSMAGIVGTLNSGRQLRKAMFTFHAIQLDTALATQIETIRKNRRIDLSVRYSTIDNNNRDAGHEVNLVFELIVHYV